MIPKNLQKYIPSLSAFVSFFNAESARYKINPSEITGFKILIGEAPDNSHLLEIVTIELTREKK